MTRSRAEDFDSELVSEAVSTEVFSSYVCRSIDRGCEHPGDISEAASISAIRLPPNDYPIWESIPDSVVSEGKLSKLQIEGIRYACAKHLEWLPTQERAGFFIGDGAGVGKGRQISGIVLDNFARGRKRHLWVSTSGDLHMDAIRDLRDLGCHMPVIGNCQELDRETRAFGLSKDFQEGVLFVTYSTMIGMARGRPRLQQIVEWLCGGGDPSAFDGCVVFDECHKAKNFVGGASGQSTKVSVAVIELQKHLPSARVVYCSATGVSEVGHMAYMTRMGLWGPGSAFRDFDSFLSSLRQRGVTFMEMLAMEMKAEGKYVARGLSFRDAEFCEVECRLGEEQIAMYNDAVELWKDLRACLGPALAATGATPQTVWRTFWSTFQRFFKLLCVSCKVPTVVREAKAALAEGFCVVIGLQTTGEAAAEALALEPGAQCGWVSTTREMLERFVNDYFPTKRPPDNKTAATAAPEELIEDPKWLQNKATLLKRIRELELPPNFLDEIIHELGGPCCVAEMTGRRGRVVSVGQNPPTYQLRAPTDSSALDSLNTQEKDAFNSGEKLVAVISDAASTGISLHSCPRFQNKRRRLHITVELPWSADKAIQQLGRTHRSNQETGPLYKLVITDLGGEKRFAAAVARRLQSLGALTRGDRRAASGIDLSSSNLDSPLGRKALRRMYDNLVTESQHLPPGVHLSTVVGVEESKHRIDEAAKAALYPMAPEQLAIQRLHRELREAAKIMEIGLEGRRSDSVAESKMSGSNSGLGDVRRFLNRLLGLPVSRQNLLFGYLSATLAAETRSAIQEGRHSEGFSDLSCSSYSLDTRSVFWTDPYSGLETVQNDFTLDRGVSFEEACLRLERERAGPGDGSGFYEMRRPLYGAQQVMLAVQKPGNAALFSVVRPNTGASYLDMDAGELSDKYRPCPDEGDARAKWTALYESTLDHCMHGGHCVNGAACQVGRRKSEVTILSGTVVRIWGALEDVLERSAPMLSKGDRAMRVVRLQLEGGGSLVGVRYPRALLPEALAVLVSSQETAAAAGRGGSVFVGAGRKAMDPPTPVDSKALSKALRAPRTMHSFFGKAEASKAPEKENLPETSIPEAAGTLQRRQSCPPAAVQRACPCPQGLGDGEHRRKRARAAGGGGDPDPVLVSQLVGMGFAPAAAHKALREARGDVQRAVNWLLALI